MLLAILFAFVKSKNKEAKGRLLEDVYGEIITNIVPEGIETPPDFSSGFMGAIFINLIFGIVALIVGLFSTFFCVRPLVLTHKRVEEFDQDDFDEMSE